MAYVGLPPGDSDKASAMLNFFRNLGGAFGISLAQTLLVRRDQFHQARLTEGLNPLNPVYENGIHRLTDILGGKQAALGMLYQEAQRQATMLGYIDVYYVLMWGVVVVLPFIPFLKTVHKRQH